MHSSSKAYKLVIINRFLAISEDSIKLTAKLYIQLVANREICGLALLPTGLGVINQSDNLTSNRSTSGFNPLKKSRLDPLTGFRRYWLLTTKR
jgi:hypothetical protein